MSEERYEPARKGIHTIIIPGSLVRDGIGTDHRAMTVAKASQGQSLHLSG